jgi:hypothetical protein
MKKLFRILGFILIMLMLFSACGKTNDTVIIKTDRNLYTPAMSSARGIKMTPDFKSKKKYTKLEYHWITGEGEFLGDFADFGKEVKNQGQTVLWSAIGDDRVIEIKNPFDVELEVIDTESQKVLASTKLTIHPNNGFYKIKK